jgi:hypothetical protein
VFLWDTDSVINQQTPWSTAGGSAGGEGNLTFAQLVNGSSPPGLQGGNAIV